MNKMKRIIALVLTILMMISMVACGKGSASGDVNKDGTKSDPNYDNGGEVVELKFWYSGTGIAYLEEMVQTFNMKQSKWNVKYSSSSSSSAVTTALGLEDVDTVDIYMAGGQYYFEYLEPLNEVLKSTADGDSKPLEEKFDSFYLQTETANDGNIYTLTTGGGALGLVYNTELFKKAGIEVAPRTSDELVQACEALKKVGVTPFIHFSGGGYWRYFLEAWQAQYDGFDYYLNNFYGCTDTKGNSPSKEVFTAKDGRYQMLKALAKILTPENVEAGASSLDHTTAQTMFIHSNIAMMANGAWLSNEMKTTGTMENFDVMKTPVVSGIKSKLTTVKSDIELRNLISAIDSVTDGEKDISEYQATKDYLKNGKDVFIVDGKEISVEDWEMVEAARNTMPTAYNGQSVFIPKYSEQKEGAIEFLKFYFSDEGYKIYTKHTHMLLPISLSEGTIDMSEWSAIEQSFNKNYLQSTYQVGVDMKCKHKIFIDGGATGYPNSNYLMDFCTRNEADRKTAEKVWADIVKEVNDNYDDWMANIK